MQFQPPVAEIPAVHFFQAHKVLVLGKQAVKIAVSLGELTDAERQIIIDGCLINHYNSPERAAIT